VGGAGSLDGLGRLVTHYTYDGLGRVIRVQRPEKPLSPPPQGVAAGTPTQLRITDTYYDGVRARHGQSPLIPPAR
jgi:hypothetical protein